MIPNPPRISVVVNTYNRARCLRTCLDALRYQTYCNFEVIVVNGPSTDDTEAVVRACPEVKYRTCPETNLSMSRNIGIAAAAGEYVAFIDDDGVADPNWLEELLAAVSSNPQVAAVGGYVRDDSGVSYQSRELVADRFGFSENSDGGRVAELPQFPHGFSFPTVMGCNCLFRRDRLLSVGGFDEQYDYFLDETDVCARLVDAGYLIDFAPRAIVLHKFESSPIRDRRKFPLDWTKIVKNTVYFINLSRDVMGDERCEAAIARCEELRTAHVRIAERDGLISHAEAETAIQTVRNGLAEGRRDSQRGCRRLMAEKVLKACSAPFAAYRTHSPSALTIVFFVDRYPPEIVGGIGRFVHQKAVKMAELGHRVHVVTQSADGAERLDFEDNVWVHRIVFKTYPNHLLDRDTAACTLPYPRMSQLYSYYEELLRIEELHHVDIVETPIWDCLGFYPLFDSRFNTVVSLQSCMKSVFADPATMPPEVPQYMQLERETLNRCKYIMPISQAIRDQLEAYYGLDLHGKSRVTNLGLRNLARSFAATPRSDSRIEVLFLGRLEHRKGVDVLLRAIPELCDKYPNLLFRFAGDNAILIPGRSETYEQAFFAEPAHEKYRGQLVFEGKVSEARLRQLYAQCDIFVSPSRYESFGLIFLEAMMFGKPVVGCRAGGMPEVIGEHLLTGMLAEPDDVSSLARCLDELIRDEKLRQRIGEAGRKRYEERFTDEVMVQNTLAYYRSVLDGSYGKKMTT